MSSVTATPEIEWVVRPPHADRQRLAHDAGIAPLLAQLFLNRGVESAADVRQFLNPDFRALHAPATLPGAAAAAVVLAKAARVGTKIVIYGDYDVDGVTATAILWHVLTLAGAKVDYYVPSRFDEGYGLNSESLERIAQDGGELVVSVDCGITAVEQVARAAELGLRVIITDHHAPRSRLPDAEVVVHPTVGDPPSPNPHLSGAGVAFKVAWALAQELSGGGARVSDQYRDFLLEATALAALGLIADVVPLTGENRVIATFGLRQLRRTANPGLQALIEVSGLTGKSRYDDYDVGFGLAPRLNAVGRMGHARLAVELFTRANEAQAAEIARTLEGHNRKRRSVERKIFKHAEEMVLQRGLDRDGCHAIVLADETWHTGVIGIVASRIVERFHRPAVLIALKDGRGQGSGRSVRHFPLNEVLCGCDAHLISHGGHAMAAGLKINADAVEAFTQAFLAEAANRLSPRDLRPRLELDDEVALCELTTELVDQLQRMSPFGTGNPRPRIATGPVELTGPPRTVGKDGRHLQFTVRQDGQHRKAIAFGRGERCDELADHRRVRLAFEPIINEWNGRRSVELKVIDWKSADE